MLSYYVKLRWSVQAAALPHAINFNICVGGRQQLRATNYFSQGMEVFVRYANPRHIHPAVSDCQSLHNIMTFLPTILQFCMSMCGQLLSFHWTSLLASVMVRYLLYSQSAKHGNWQVPRRDIWGSPKSAPKMGHVPTTAQKDAPEKL